MRHRIDMELTKNYKQNPSLRNYVQLRRLHPDKIIEVGIVESPPTYMAAVLDKFGIDSVLLNRIADADTGAISEVALQLMERLAEREHKKRQGETHLVSRGIAIPDQLVDWIITFALDAFSLNDDVRIPRDLIVLIRERLGGSHQHLKALRTDQKRNEAIKLGARMMAMGQVPTFRSLGKALGVAPSTVKRWFPHGNFTSWVQVMSYLFDKQGKRKSLKKLAGGK